MNGIMRYPGGKGKLKDEILSRIQSYYSFTSCFNTCEYVEPFFGAGSVGLAFLERCPVKNICINDKDIGMSALWTSIIYLPDKLCEMVGDFVPSVDKFFEYKKSLRDYVNLSNASTAISMIADGFINTNEIYSIEDVERDLLTVAMQKLAIHQMSYSGLGTVAGGPIGGKQQDSNYKIDCRWNASSLKNKIYKLHQLLSKTKIRYNSCMSYDWSSILADCDKLSQSGVYECFIYLDPPYFEKGPELYQFYFTLQDHQDLSSCLKDTKHPWLLSYDNSEEIRKMYKWANIQEVSVNYSINKSRNNKELLISNPRYDFFLCFNDYEYGF